MKFLLLRVAALWLLSAHHVRAWTQLRPLSSSSALPLSSADKVVPSRATTAWLEARRQHHLPLLRLNLHSRSHESTASRQHTTKKSAAVAMAAALAFLLLPALPHPAAATTTKVPVLEAAAPRSSSIHSSSSSSQNHILTRTPSQLLLSESDNTLKQEPGAVLDEVWGLVDKYYIDRNFNGQDWKKVQSTYQGRLPKQASLDDETEMKVAKDMVQTLGDKYSRLLSVAQYTAIQKYDLIGVGVTLMPSPQQKDSIIVGAPPIAGSAAAQAGLQVGDRVTKVNGVPTQGRTAFDIIDQISEAPNAPTITMTIQSADGSATTTTRDVTMERQFQEVKNPIRYKITETRSDGTVVGFVRISEFNSLVKANLQDALTALQEQGANALVLDLRRNGGGAFQSAVEISSLFVPNQIATYVVDGTQAVLPFRTASNQVLVKPHTPLVLWVDSASASASEVLAASLHDNCQAVIMGQTSFGKGLIQAVYGLKNGAGLVLTVAKYITPRQQEIQGVGIVPDVPGKNIVPSSSLVPLPFGAGGIAVSVGDGDDTSRIDFADVRNRLNMCVIPEPAKK